MIVSVLTIADSDGGFEDNDYMEDFLKKDNYCYESVSVLEDIDGEEFEVTDSIDQENLKYICRGRACEIIEAFYNLNEVYWNYWCYIKKDNKWIKVEDYYAS